MVSYATENPFPLPQVCSFQLLIVSEVNLSFNRQPVMTN